MKRCVLLFCLCLTQSVVAVSSSDDNPFDCILSMVEPTDGASRKVTLLCDLVEAYASSGQKDKAMRFLSQAIEEAGFQQKAPAPNNPFADLQAKDNVKSLIAAYGYVGMYEQAIALINTLDRKSERGRYLKWIADEAASAGQKGKILESLAEAVKAVSLPNPEPGDLSFIAITYAIVGEYEKAVQTARTISNKWLFVKAQTFTEIASEYIKDKQAEKASELIAEVLKIVQATSESGGDIELDSKTEAFTIIADAYIEIGQNDKSIRLLSQALELTKKYDTDNVALENITAAYAKMGEYEQAKRVAASIDFEPSQSDAFAAIAHSYLDVGQKKQALEMLERALRITASLKRESAEFKLDDMVDLAVEFAKADQKKRTAEVLLSALQEVRREYRYNQPSHLIIIAKAYLKAGMKPDAQAKDIIHKICIREPIPVTAEEQEKQRRVEQAADLFIQRWHETLDLNVLFDEMFVSNAKQRTQNAGFFYGIYQFMTASGDGPAVDKDVDEKVMREGFMAFCNMYFLHNEYLLAYMQSTDASPKYPPDILSAGQEYRKLKLDPKRMTRAQVMEFVAKANNVSSVYRKHLPPQAFKSPRYQENSKPEQDDSDNDSKPFGIIKGFPEYFVADDKEVYKLRRGIFDLYFVEEEGKLKVLLLGLEL